MQHGVVKVICDFIPLLLLNHGSQVPTQQYECLLGGTPALTLMCRYLAASEVDQFHHRIINHFDSLRLHIHIAGGWGSLASRLERVWLKANET